MLPFQRSILYLTTCAALSASLGCNGFFKKPPSLFHRGPKQLPAIQTAREAVQLEIVTVERPFGDLLLSSLWQEVDQIGDLDPEVEKSLRENGFRVGVASSSPPRVLQSLLGLASAKTAESTHDARKQWSGRRVVLRPGAETEIQSSPVYFACSIEVPTADGKKLKDYDNVRCLFRVKAQRLQDGWAKLEFLPEIHYGDRSLRYAATDAGWYQQTSQRINRLFGQRFEVTLNLGEMVLITADGKNPRSAGRHFFVGADDDAKVQRLLVVRLAGMGNTQPVYAE